MHQPLELLPLVGRTTFDRGMAYARAHRAVVTRHDPALHEVTGKVEGSGRNLYSVIVEYGLTRNGVIDDFSSFCSCPVQHDCKHGVALLATALEQDRLATKRRTPTVSSWRRTLEDVFPDPAARALEPLALAFRFRAPGEENPRRKPSGYFGRYTTERGELSARAMRRGKRNNWIATGAAWIDILRGAPADAPREQIEALGALARLAQTADPYSYGTPTWLPLHTLRGRALWTALDDIAAAGVHLHTEEGAEVELARNAARAEIAVADRASHAEEEDDDARPGEVTVSAVVTRTEALRDTLLVGEPTSGVAGRDEDGRLVLVPLAHPATRAWVELHRRGTVRVPAAERELFERTILPRIAREDWVGLGGYEPAAPPAPTLVVRVRMLIHDLGSAPRATVELEWRYGGPHAPFALTYTLPADPRSTARDSAAEGELLRSAATAMSPLPVLLGNAGTPREEAVVVGHGVVTLVEEVLPALEVLDGVELDLPEEELPAYRDLGEPTIDVAVTGSQRDWFDLEVRLRLADREVPIGLVITALVRGEKTLFLEDGGYVALDRPELDRLRGLLEEGRSLQDARRAGLRVNRLNLSWWEELEALGVIDHQITAWLDRLRNATVDGPPPPLPEGLTATLRPYQRAGYEWLARLRRNGLGGVLADDMGLGKTLQALAMILDARQTPADTMPDGGTGPDGGAAARGPWLVVAPTSVVPNWAAEAARFTPDLRVVAVNATEKRRGVPLSAMAEGADVIVTSYALFRLEFSDYQELAPAGLVLDEAQAVKNRQSKAFALAKTLDAGVTFAITGTPMENDLSELWAMFALTAPGLLGTPHQFHELYAAPIERGNGVELGLLERLRRRIAPFLLRRTKEEVTPELPAKQEQILSVELAPAHRRVYAQHLSRERQRVLGLVADLEHNRVEVLSALTRLRQLAIDASLVDPANADVPSSKLDVLLPLLREAAAEGHRVLVFSQFTRYLKLIAGRLEAEGLAFSYLDGTTRRRAEVIRGFAEGTQPVFLISLKAGGVGLNLAMADYCVLADPWWNPATEAQAVDRAHRIGQTRTVMVYRLVAKDTIEEKVMALQDSKRALVAGVLGTADDAAPAPAGSSRSRAARLTAEDVRELLG